MKQILKLLSGFVLLSMVGCNLGKPPPGYIYMWEKNSVTDFTEVGKALLECGMPTPYDVNPENQKLSPNDMVSIDACMVQAGFRYKGRSNWCYTFKEDNLPNCRPGVVFPKRSVKKRLNSPFCKKHPEQYECYP
ncbi:hypothetical protein [Bartonella henselae]|uniref:hypothetical protein n=1 Tax=Bartonella henselae TaxID=38323 RepID=UPI000964581C|nr:hypothetical protein [Bartonella henselae]OLL41165.1 hypothetical protein AT244_04805 [Bartonella henselae]OLL45494.1 hypothetical protein AT245_07470 [Bartonella henselae]